MSKELDDIIWGILYELKHYPDDNTIDDVITQIKAAILESLPAKISTTNDHDYYHGEVSGYNQAITEITEKLK